MLNLIRNTVSNFRTTQATQDSNSFLAAAGITGQVQSQAIYNLVNDLQASGLWSKMKAVYPMITDNRNLWSYTNDVTAVNWIRNNFTASANTTTAPDGTLTADTLIENTANANHYIANQVGAISLSNGNCTMSIYAKKIVRDWFAVSLYDGTIGRIAWFNINNGTIGTVQSGATANISDAGNGWYRCSITMPMSASNINYTAYYGADADNSVVYTGNGVASYYVWGAQLEIGALSTYQPILTTPAAFMASQMKYNLKDARDLDAAFRLAWSGGWTYSATGATPNGTNAFADTKLLPSTNLSQNSTHLSSYIRNTSQGVLLGTDNAFRLWIAPNFNGINKYVEINSGATTAPSATISSATGLWVGNRIINTQSRLYNNNSLNYTATSTSAGLDTSNIFLSARNAGGASNYTSSQVAFASIGDGLSEQETLLLNQITEKYQVALSRGVQAAQSFYYNSAYSNEANTYLYSTQITGTTQVSAINTLINGLKANNLWTKMKAVYPFVTDKINLIGYTEDFANAYWGTFNATITSNTTLAPNGTLTADTFTRTSSIGYVYTATPLTLNADKYTISVYAKANTNSTFRLDLVSSGLTQGVVCTFDLSNGTASTPILYGTANNFTAAISDAGNGWYRCSLTGNLNTSTAYYSEITLTTGGSIFIWGNQVELGNLSTYQPVLAANNYATNVAAQMKFNLVNPQDSDAAFRLAFSGGWTYSTNGAQPNGTNGFADTFLIPNTSLSTSSSHLSFYSRTNTTSGTGYDLARTHFALITQFNGNIFYANLETAGSYAASYTSANGLGHFIASRINNTTTQGFKNGLKVINASQNSSLATSSLIISNNGGANYSNKQTAFVSIGDGFTDAEAALLYSLVQQFQTDLTRQV
jgi:hypothetical protein